MTDGEICRSYRGAAKPERQIGILRDLTGYSTAKIIVILMRNGEKVPDKYMKRLENRLDAIDLQIKELEQEYAEIANTIMKAV